MFTDIFLPFPVTEISPGFDETSVDEGPTLFGYITAADAQSGLETSFGRYSTVHCAPEEFSDSGKQKASFGARTFPVHQLVLMRVVNPGSSPVKSTSSRVQSRRSFCSTSRTPR